MEDRDYEALIDSADLDRKARRERGPVTRYALVTGASSRRQLEAYMPANYRVIHGPTTEPAYGDTIYVISGRDALGWTLDSYVIPRLASGLIWATEIDLSHPVMREVPA